MDEVAEWRAQAERCRRLARESLDERAKRSLIDLAVELEAKVARSQLDGPGTESDPSGVNLRGG